MASLMRKTIYYLFIGFFFLVPLVFYPKSSELFELNKTVLTYLFALLIFVAWGARIVFDKKLHLTKTVLFLPFFVFLASQTLSTVFSIDRHTSLFGFYSRFHGGLLSSVAYVFLFFAFVSNIAKRESIVVLKTLLFSAIVVSMYGIAQHFGIDAQIWQQDVKERVFSTLGQPNWLATFLAALLPFTLYFEIAHKPKTKTNLFWLIASALMLTALLFTRSKSGIAAGALGMIVYLGLAITSSPKTIKKWLVAIVALGILTVVVGTPWSKSLEKQITNQGVVEQPAKVFIPALERGGTDSGIIRKIVWKGAIDIWKNYPLLGSGVETFGYSYYMFRPAEHNLVSEWDYLYNKAHNEYLHLLATTGAIGLISYLYLVVSIVILFLKALRKDALASAFLASTITILAANFFGFSVVNITLLHFVLPAFLLVRADDKETTEKKLKLNAGQGLGLLVIACLAIFLTYKLGRFWVADTYFAAGRELNSQARFPEAREKLLTAANSNRGEADYFSELAESAAGVALLFDAPQKVEALKFANLADIESLRAVNLAPANVNMLRNRANSLIKISLIDPSYLQKAENALTQAISLAPTDAKLYYNLGLVYKRQGKNVEAKETMTKTVGLKSDYRNARFALALFLKEEGLIDLAKAELEYVLEFIDPSDTLVKNELDSLQ